MTSLDSSNQWRNLIKWVCTVCRIWFTDNSTTFSLWCMFITNIQTFWEITTVYKWKFVIFYFSCHIEVKSRSQSVHDLKIMVLIRAILTNENVIEVIDENKVFRLSDLLKNMGRATCWDLSTDLRQLQIFFIGTLELEKL